MLINTVPKEYREVVALLPYLYPFRRRLIGLHFARIAPFSIPVSAATSIRFHARRYPHKPHPRPGSAAPSTPLCGAHFSPLAHKRNFRRKRHVPAYLLPRILKRVVGNEIFSSASGDRVLPIPRIVNDAAPVPCPHVPHIPVSLEHPHRALLLRQASGSAQPDHPCQQ